MRRPCIVLALGLLCLPTWAMAQVTVKESSTSPAVSKFVMGTRLGYITCSDKYKAYLEKWELYALVTEGQREPQGTPPADSEVADCVHQTALRGPEGRDHPESEVRLQRIHGRVGRRPEGHTQARARNGPAVPGAAEAGRNQTERPADEARGCGAWRLSTFGQKRRRRA
jgi:hypothetical protein